VFASWQARTKYTIVKQLGAVLAKRIEDGRQVARQRL
jgi:hypothetical protein